jgi:isoleucyl-tRNA synthetase
MILAEDGKKMSKRLKNFPDPSLIFEKYGSDALRLYMISSPAVRSVFGILIYPIYLQDFFGATC